MDGTLAAIYFLAALLDMNANYCPTGCLQRNEVDSRVSIQGSEVWFQDDPVGREIYLGYDLGHARGPFQRGFALSVTDEGAIWLGTVTKTQWEIGNGFFIEGSSGPGYYRAGDGPDLSSRLQFRSSFGIGYEFDNGALLSLHLDHRSNAGLEEPNPGLETIGLRYSMILA